MDLYKEDNIDAKIEILKSVFAKMEPLSHKKDSSQLRDLLLKESPIKDPNTFIQRMV